MRRRGVFETVKYQGSGERIGLRQVFIKEARRGIGRNEGRGCLKNVFVGRGISRTYKGWIYLGWRSKEVVDDGEGYFHFLGDSF